MSGQPLSRDTVSHFSWLLSLNSLPSHVLEPRQCVIFVWKHLLLFLLLLPCFIVNFQGSTFQWWTRDALWMVTLQTLRIALGICNRLYWDAWMWLWLGRTVHQGTTVYAGVICWRCHLTLAWSNAFFRRSVCMLPFEIWQFPCRGAVPTLQTWSPSPCPQATLVHLHCSDMIMGVWVQSTLLSPWYATVIFSWGNLSYVVISYCTN